METSFEEKIVWVNLLALLAVLAYYVTNAAQLFAAGISNIMTFIPLFISSVILMILITVAASIVVAITAGSDGRDERDRLIAWRAEGHTSWLFVTGILGAMAALVAPIDIIWVAHILFVTLFAHEIINSVLRIYYYRRGL